VDDNLISQLRTRLTHDDKKQLLKDLALAPAWVADVMRKIATAKKS